MDCARQIFLSNKSAHEATDKKFQQPLHTLCSAMHQPRSGMQFAEDIYDMLLLHDASGLTLTDMNGRLPLHLLCEAGFFSIHAIHILEKMLKQEDSTIMARDTHGRLPLHLLCESKPHTQLTYDAYRRLVREARGEIANAATIQTHDGSLPVHNLCGAGHHSEYSVNMFRALVEAFPTSISALDSSGKIAMHRLCGASGHTDHTEEIFEELLGALKKIGKNGAELRTLQGVLPLHIISGAGHHTANTYRIFTKLLQLFEGSCIVASTMEKQLPMHVLCEAPNHTHFSEKMCSDLITANTDSVRSKDARSCVPLEVLCGSQTLSSSSVEICNQIVRAADDSHVTQWLSALQVLCDTHLLSKHSVGICEVILGKMRGLQFKPNVDILPVHALCRAKVHNDSTEHICKMLLAACPDWASFPNDDGWLPLHVVCQRNCHEPPSVHMCNELLAMHPDACLVSGGSDGALPLHVLASNGLQTASSIEICQTLLKGPGEAAARQRSKLGLLPLHLLCSGKTLTDSSIEICELLLHAYADAAGMTAGDEDKDLPLHILCLTTPHSAQSARICRLLVNAYGYSISTCGNHHNAETLHDMEMKGLDPSKEAGDEPLIILCQVDTMTRYTAEMCMLTSGNGVFNIHPALSVLHKKVYSPEGDDTQQKQALRALISLVFVTSEDASSYIELDSDSTSGPRDVNFLKEVEREMGVESENALLHVLRMSQLYRIEGEKAGLSVLVTRLNNLSQQCMEWAVAMVDALPARIAKRAIWTPEKYSNVFMRGSSPIGIAMDLGDLKIVSSPAVFDVVRRAWPGKYKYDFNPIHGTIFSNLLLDYEIVGSSNNRHIIWKWHCRINELLRPSILISSPMNMYFLGIMMQVALLAIFQVTLDLSHQDRPYPYSMGPPEVYLIMHVIGGIIFEIGQVLEGGVKMYLQDPWNSIDMGMYGLLAWWAYARSTDWQAVEAGQVFIPDHSQSATYMGLAGICIWIRILNVFGLDPYFGPLVRIMQGMTSGVMTFLVLLAIFVMGFSTALRTIFSALDPSELDLIKADFSAIIAEYKDPVFSIVALLNMALGQFDLQTMYQVSKTALVVVFMFLACTFVMLFNLLIALMTDTYAEIRLESTQLWKKDRALLMAQYTSTDLMLESFSMATLMTGLPQPLNLVVVVLVSILLPFYLVIEMHVHTKTWQRKANDLRLLVTKSFLFLAVCLPSAIVFCCVALPLNWIFVASAGTLEYMDIKLLSRQPAKRILVSRMLGIAGMPVFLLYLFFVAGPRFLHNAYRERQALSGQQDADHDDFEDSAPHDQHSGFQVAGKQFGHIPDIIQGFNPTDRKLVDCHERSLHISQDISAQGFGTSSDIVASKEVHIPGDMVQAKSTFAPSLDNDAHLKKKQDEKAMKMLDEKIEKHHHMQHGSHKVKEVWQEDLDDDDIMILHEIHIRVKPLDIEEVEAAAESAQKEQDKAISELKQDLSKIFAKVENRQKMVQDCLRGLQDDTRKFQQVESTEFTVCVCVCVRVCACV